MNNEDKMREEFESHLISNCSLADLNRYADGEYFHIFINIRWADWKACASIKDAESVERITALQMGWNECINKLAIKDAEIADMEHMRNSAVDQYLESQNALRVAKTGIASRDLLIKELREALRFIADSNSDDEPWVLASEVFAKTEYYDSRALDKLLLKTRIDELSNLPDNQSEAPEVVLRIAAYEMKLAELNKE